ncbi:MAG TPA: PAS-domain containing protein [Azospirillaceae bacterium]|nr:PAS-domain containing protein [Azospirillaceae bacterium]
MTAEAANRADEIGLIDRLAAPMLVARFDGGVIRLNPAAQDLLRARLGDVVGGCLDELDVAYPTERLDALRREPPGVVLRMLIGLRRRGAINSGVTTLDARLSRLDDDALLIEGVAESAARREIQRLTEQLVALSFGYPDMRVEVTPDGVIQDFVVANPADINIQPERLLERNILKAFPAEAGEKLMAAVARFAQGEGGEGAAFSLDGPAGEQFFEARLVALGDAARILVTIRNVTDRVRAEREAERTRDRLVEALESIADGFVLYDQDDRLVLANSRYRELFDPTGVIIAPGAKFEDVLTFTARSGIYGFAPEYLESWLEERLRLHRGGGGASMEAQLADGRWLRIQERLTPAGDRVGLRTDITELKRREAELQAAREAAEKANEQKTGFVHHLSHELRTPLNAVLGFAQMIAEELLGPAGNPRYPAYARQIAEAGAYMLELINNLLDLAKIDAGRLTLAEEACDITILVELIFSMIGDRAKRTKVELVSLLEENPPRLVADPTLVRQMLTNLIANAIKFCPSDGTGRVEVMIERPANGGLALVVRDNGAGMSPEQIPRALSPFEQAHDRKVTPEVGTGLGLPLTRALIELHNGRFEIESALGKGATARLIFPAARVACLTDGDGI